MTRTRHQIQILSQEALLQQIQSIVSTTTITPEQHQQLMQVISAILQACAQTTPLPLPTSDMQEIRGHNQVKRALEVAAAGGHPILLVGPAGAGKTLLARALLSLLPITALPSPFQEPSSNISWKDLVGDPTIPATLSLALDSVLFLKDLDTFDLPLLTSLAQTVETQVVSIPLQEGSVTLPAHFHLVATMKPCPCELAGNPARSCRCTAQELVSYRQRFKEVLRSCFALQMEVPRLGEEILSHIPEESSATIRQRVETARAIQHRRYAKTTHLRVNADLRSVEEIQQYCPLDDAGEKLLRSALRQLHLTPLHVLRVQAVARTIADLASSPLIAVHHLAEALHYLSRLVRDD
jgi:magnesium chelatase family protein